MSQKLKEAIKLMLPCKCSKNVLQELSRTHLYFNGIFYLYLGKDVLILTEVNFLHLLHYPCFLLHAVKKRASQKSLPTPRVCALTLI